MTGMARHGGVLPVGGTFFVFSDYMRPAVRLAALSEAHVIYSWTHDSVGLGRGRAHPSAHRAPGRRCGPCRACGSSAPPTPTRPPTPGASPWTPTGPPALVLTRQSIPVLEGTAEAADGVARGGYVLVGPDRRGSRHRPHRHGLRGLGVRRCRRRLPAADAPVRPGWCRCRPGTSSPLQPESYRDERPSPRCAAPGRRGRRLVRVGAIRGRRRLHRHFGASAPGAIVLEHFGYTPDNVAARARALLARGAPAGGG